MNPSRVLFVGTGGGNDVVSTFFAILQLSRSGFLTGVSQFDIAGVLSPFHRHSVETTGIPGVYITQPYSGRHLLRRGGEREIRFVDAKLAEMLQERHQENAPRVLGLSLKYGAQGLANAFRRLAKEYDLIVLVDVGGDILYRGAVDEHVLSPMFDAMVLRAFVDSGAPGLLFEAGPGTDGELSPEALASVLAEVEAEEYPLIGSVVDDVHEFFTSGIASYRSGRTIPVTIQAARSSEDYLEMPYRARAHLGDVRRYGYFDHRISTALCKKVFLIDPSKIVNPFAVHCTSPIDWFLKTQAAQHHTNNECNLEYWRDQDGVLTQLLTPSPLLSDDDRMELIGLALQELSAKVCDRAIMLAADFDRVSSALPSNVRVENENGLIHLVNRS